MGAGTQVESLILGVGSYATIPKRAEMRAAKGDGVCMTSDLGSRKCSAQVMGRLEGEGGTGAVSNLGP